MPRESTKGRYESVKVNDDDYARIRQIRIERGLSMIEAIGVASEAWAALPRRTQDQIIRRRSAKYDPSAVAQTV